MKTTLNTVNAIIENAQADRAAFIRSLAVNAAAQSAAPSAAESFRIADILEAAQADRAACIRSMAVSFADQLASEPVMESTHMVPTVEDAQTARTRQEFRSGRALGHKLGSLLRRKPHIAV